jgi:isoleucyl-tRNA synthetase
MAEKPAQDKKVSFKETLNLPRTDFPIRANAKIDDPAMLQRWAQENLSEKTFTHNKGKAQFILHDGPPYANGNIHIGHAYNKIIKDIVVKSQRMFGKHAPVTPGWDCHGLPIELKVSQEHKGASRQELKKACRAYAQKWIDVQREEFKSLGVLMDWERPYLTMDYGYEASILRAFGEFVDAGYIERKNKTVPWCPSCQTVLASAEIEYQERKDPSIYVLFPLEADAANKVFPQLNGEPVNVLIWTTTPWTLPLNRAVLLKPKAEYVVIDINGKYVAIGKQLADQLCTELEVEKKVAAEFVSDELAAVGARAQHPFVENLVVPLILDQSVLLEDGTAFVHSAPGVGPEDYEVGVRNNLEIYSPITPDGKYSSEINPKELEGMSIADGQIWVIKKLAGLDRLLLKKNIRHSYPHCWRCRNGLIFRATKQWFCDLAKNQLKERTLGLIDTIKTIPEKSINRLKATIEGRLEWCLSRQRVWGVPITAVICNDCDYTYITKDMVDAVADQVAKSGIEYWDTVDIATVAPQNFTCPGCKGTNFKKEQDILDVWFDSGVSHYAVLKNNSELGFPADMYLEGKDQHRGWFQSSLLTGMVLEGKPPMKTIVTHGFTVDEKGRKMSKSIGNVVSPQEMIDKLGTDGLRMWASSIDGSGDAVVSDVLIRNVQEVFRKVRNTSRFLLSNLYDFDIASDTIPFDQLRAIDQYALQELTQVNADILASYNKYDLTAVFHKLGDYCAVNLSAFYLDIVKDRLYVAQADGHERRSTQTACWYILDTLTKLMAPILSFTAEQIYDQYKQSGALSIHLEQFNDLSDTFDQLINKVDASKYEQLWQTIKTIRSAVLKAIEQLRETGSIKHPLEAQLTVYFDPQAEWASSLQSFFKELESHNESVETFFKELVIVSRFDIAHERGELPESAYKGFYIKVEPATGDKCPRCWHWDETDHEHKLCSRCQGVVAD